MFTNLSWYDNLLGYTVLGKFLGLKILGVTGRKNQVDLIKGVLETLVLLLVSTGGAFIDI